jgi:oxygen-independent coproporphyrinogen-3 oxidase
MDHLAVYVHIPFCVAKCHYCTFNSYSGLQHLHQDYVHALVKEIELWAGGRPPVQAGSVYLGGGTPSSLSIELLDVILGACRENLSPAPDAEISMEANPGTVSAESLSSLREQGVNRLSLGAQSFDDSTLRLLGRIHTAADVKRGYHLAREAGWDNINLDFIYGVPGQTLERWKADLSEAIELHPEHLSLYCLTVEEGTPLAGSISRGELPTPDPDLAADMYVHAEETLDGAGYEHYEISNWALPGRECQHNLTYWRNLPYVGFGAGAHSFHGRSRYHNTPSPQEYVQRVLAGQAPIAGKERIDETGEMSETMILGLRMSEGVSFRDFEDRFGVSPIQAHGKQIRELIDLGLLDATAHGIRLTARGRLLGNEVFECFLRPVTD